MQFDLPGLALLISALGLFACDSPQDSASPNTDERITSSTIAEENDEAMLRHLVLFKFNEQTSEVDLEQIERAFNGLPSQIPEIADYEWGINNSPEGLDQGYTHAYLLSFQNEADRAVYLPHPAHVAFTEVVGPHVDDVHVIDYWARGADD